MSTPENVFKGDRTLIGNVDVDGPLAKAEAPCCEYYSSAYELAIKQAEECGDANGVQVYRFLQVMMSFQLSFDTPAQPFVPFMRTEGKRTFIPSDLPPDDIEAVRELSKVTKDPALRSRLFDVLWERTSDYRLCAEAATSYIDAAERLDVPEHWAYAVNCYQRGLYLSAKLGREKGLFTRASESLQQAARNSANDAEQFRCCQFLELLIRFGCGNPAELAAIAAGQAQKAADAANPTVTCRYREVEAVFHRLAKNPVAEKAALIIAAEASVTEAQNRAQGAGASFIAAASLLSKAIEALRQAGAAKARINELRRLMNDWQQRSLAEFQTVSTGMDISKLVSAARNHVKGASFQEAVLKLAFGQRLSDISSLKADILQTAKEAPLTYLMGAAMVDEQGRTIKRKESLFDLGGEALEAALEEEAFSHAARFHWPLRVDGFIEPGREQILNDHKPTFQDLLFIVRSNPFVPPGHEGIFRRGLHAGFHGDFLVASHLLTPQVENSLRYVLESNGVDVSNLMSDGTQPVKVLGAIFGMNETKQIFGDPLCFELRGCLIEKTGYDFRNRIAHGFVQEGECYETAAVTVWWLVLRLCLMPVFQTIVDQQKQVQ